MTHEEILSPSLAAGRNPEFGKFKTCADLCASHGAHLKAFVRPLLDDILISAQDELMGQLHDVAIRACQA